MLILDRIDDKIKVQIAGSSNEFYSGLDYVKSIPGATYDPDDKYWYIDPDRKILSKLARNNRTAYKKDKYTLLGIKPPQVKTPLHLIKEEYGDIKKYYNQLSFDNMKDTLHSFQKIGVCAAHYCLQNYGGFIFMDDVGLGKTIETLGTLETLDFNKALILSPKNVKYQWGEEIENFTDYKPVVVDGYNKKKRLEMFEEEGDIYILNHDQVILKDDFKEIKKLNCDVLIIDEIHHFKSHDTKRYSHITALKNDFKYRIGLTATAISNELQDLYNIVDVLINDYFGEWKNFSKNHVEYAYMYNRPVPVGYKDLFKINQQRSIISIQRDTTDVENDLPEKHQKIHFFEVSEYQMNIHEKIQAQIESKQEELRDCDESEEEEINGSIQGLLNLQIAVANDLNLLRNSESYFVRDFVNKEDIPENFVCPKINYLNDLIEKVLNHDDEFKMVLFSKFVSMIEEIEKHLNANGIKYAKIIGDFSEKRRHEEKMKLKNNDDVRILVTSDAGAEGINLQFCSHLVNIDIPWNPKTLKQRIGRICRIGSKWDHVFISNLVSSNTREESLLDTIARKQNLIDSVIKNTYDQKEFLKNMTKIMSK